MLRSFPLRLLDDFDDVRSSYFAKSSIKHPKLTEVTKQLWRALNSRVDESIIFVYGPAGVGKTTLCEHVINKTIEQNNSLINTENHKDIPVTLVDAATPDNSRFDWKHFYQHAIFNMESSVCRKKKARFIPYNPRLAPALYFSQNLKPCEFRNHFIDTLRKYKPNGFFIDEAQHLAKVNGTDRLLNQMDIIKTIRKYSNTKMILVGPYDLVPFRNLSGQLSRRSWDIHFPRYSTSLEDLNDFQSTILTLQKKLPLQMEPDFIPHWKYIYTKSVGCVGIMKDWFLRALEIAIDEKQKTISFDLLAQCALSDNQCLNIALEASNGEQLVNGTKESFKELMEAVGFKEKGNKRPQPKEKPLTQQKNKRGNRKPKVGRAKARRDPVNY